MQDTFLNQLAQPRPDPGGGAAAAHGGLLSLAIMEKVVRLEVGRVPRDERKSDWQDLLQRIRTLADEFHWLREGDCVAYMKLAEAKAAGLRGCALADAWEEAIACPMMMAKCSVRTLGVLSDIGSLCGKHLIADLQVAAEFLAATFRGAFHIAKSNVHAMSRDGIDDRHSARLSDQLIRAESQLRSVQEQLRLRSVPKRTS